MSPLAFFLACVLVGAVLTLAAVGVCEWKQRGRRMAPASATNPPTTKESA